MSVSINALRTAARASLIACSLVVLLTACGGGGNDSTTPPTELPTTLSVNGPATRQSVGATTEFASNATDAANRLSYQWTFGDGATSTSAKPTHAYAKPGVYSVHVTVTNEAGASREASFEVTVSDMSIVQGKICNGADGSGWCWQRPLPQGNLITQYFYLDDKHAWAVGSMGTILATTDGGVTWTAQHSGTELSLYSVNFVDANVGWIGGNSGTVLRTIDGGAHWNVTSIGQSDVLSSIKAVDANTAWATNFYGGGVFVTKDGGSHWSVVTYPSASRYSAVTADDVWVATYSYWGTDSLLAHTTDAGATWTQIAGPASDAGLYRSVAELRFTDSSHGWLQLYENGYDADGHFISRLVGYRTSDSGKSWQAFENPDPLSPSYYGFNFQFIDAVTAFARSNATGSYRRTTDGGASWQSIPLPDTVTQYSGTVTAFTATVLQASDYNATYITFDAGTHWTRRSETVSPALNSVWFFGKDGIAIADDGGSVRTADGGQTWTKLAPLGNTGWHRLQFLADGSVGWVISDTGTLYRSTDKGLSWLSPVPQASAQMYGVTDFHFVDAMNGWAVTPLSYGSGATFYRSTDGGTSWQASTGYAGPGGFRSLRFADSMHGVAVGISGVALVTSDGGTSWQARSSSTYSPLNRVVFADGHTAVAVGEGGTIVRSTDQGQTWSRVPSPTTNLLSDIVFLTAVHGIAVGDYGTVLVTKDGGLSWTTQATGTDRNLKSVFVADDQTAWAVGDNSTILVTATGGR